MTSTSADSSLGDWDDAPRAIIVRLDRAYPFDKDDTLLRVAEREPSLAALAHGLRELGIPSLTPLVASVSAATVREWELEAGSCTELRPIRSLLQYWRLPAQHRIAVGERITPTELVVRLADLPHVDHAYLESPVAMPTVNSADDPKSANQTYLDSPFGTSTGVAGGVNARAAWVRAGGDGNGIGFVDIEGGWLLDHEDLASRPFVRLTGTDEDPGWRPHGTSVLGIVTATDNTLGIVGVAPNATPLFVASVFRGGDTLNQRTVDALLCAIDATNPGDIFLLEVQSKDNGKHVPIESEDATFDAIRLSAALGRIVVEAAGNGLYDNASDTNIGLDLDAYSTPSGNVLQRGARESGAILVAASRSGAPYLPVVSSNFGTRVDCFAPGEMVFTTSADDSTSKSLYDSTFAQTSAASAIVAGAALSTQGMWRARTGGLLSALQMRALLSDPTLNTPQAVSTSHIGVMPDLLKIADSVLPDVYIRDDIFDDGAVPSTGAVSQSPDIIVRWAAVVNAAAAFGEGSGTEQRVDLSDAVLAGADHTLYARVRNRGPVAAPGTTVTIYWSESATLLTPDHWHPIGTTVAFDVPAGDILTVSPALTWSAANVPASGHYCFVAVTSQAGDLAPPATGALMWDQFFALIRGSNNITWRNFNVVDVTSSSAMLVLPFVIAGATDRRCRFVLEVDARLLPSHRARLIVPAALAHSFREMRRAEVRMNDDGTAELPLDHVGGLRPMPLVLDAGARHRCAIVLEPPFVEPCVTHRLAVRQHFESTEVGRITWVFRNGDRDVANR